MGDIVNLNKFRKQKTRDLREKQADDNRIKFGLTKAQKNIAKTETEKRQKKLDRKKLDDPDHE